MNNILLVEHNTELIGSLEREFKKHEPQLNLLLAANGAEAIDVLEKTAVSVLVTDLYMPKVDGLELLAYMSQHNPKTPVIMATVSTPEVMGILETLGIFRFLKKPYKPEALVEVVNEAVLQASEGKITRRLSTGSFLLLLQEEQRNCSLTAINHKGLKGRFYLIDGRLYDARCGAQKGEDAAITMLGWEKVALDLKDLQTEDIKARIHLSLKALIEKTAGLAKKDAPLKKPAQRKEAPGATSAEGKKEPVPQPQQIEEEPSQKPEQKKVLKKEDLAKMLAQAVRLAESGNLVRAHHILGKILQIYPKSSTAWLWLARTTDAFNTLNISLNNAVTIAPNDPEITEEIKKTKSAVNAGCGEASKLKHCPFCWAPVQSDSTSCHYCNAHIDIHEDFFQSIFFGSNKEPDLAIINQSLQRFTKAANSSLKNVHTHFLLALAHVNLNQWQEAMAELNQTDIVEPENNPYRNQLEIMADFIDDLSSFYQD